MREVALIFPHQLFKMAACIAGQKAGISCWGMAFFQEIYFSQPKAYTAPHLHEVLRSLSKRKWRDGWYIDSTDRRNNVRVLIAALHSQSVTGIHISDVANCWLLKRIESAFDKYSIALIVYPSPSFLNTMDDVADYFDKKKSHYPLVNLNGYYKSFFSFWKKCDNFLKWIHVQVIADFSLSLLPFFPVFFTRKTPVQQLKITCSRYQPFVYVSQQFLMIKFYEVQGQWQLYFE